MATEKVFTSRDGAVFIQRHASAAPEYLGCYDLGDVSPDEGGIELIRGRDAQGRYQVRAHTEAPPEVIEFTLTTWAEKAASFLERVVCPFYVHVNKRCGGIANAINNYDRGYTLVVEKRSGRNLTSLAMREEDAASDQEFTMQASPPLLDIYRLTPDRSTTAEAQAANDVIFVKENLCGDCTPYYEEGKIGMAVHDAVGAGIANVTYTLTGGSTWLTCAADPFTTNENIAAVTYFWLDGKRIRFMVARGTTDAGNPAEVAYTDFNLETDTAIGAVWTLANVGSTNAQFFFGPKSLFSYDYFNIWGVAGAGFIYKSENGGTTWTAQESGVITVDDFYVIRFAPGSKLIGYAAGENNAFVKTINGGVTWSAVTGPSATDELLTLEVLSEKLIWTGDNAGDLWVSYNGGLTWTESSPSGTWAQIRAVAFLNEVQGFCLTNTAGPVATLHVTRDCGQTWEALTTPTNAGMNALDVVRNSLVFAVGEPQGSTAMILSAASYGGV